MTDFLCKMRNLVIITVGIPGSGKTTWAKHYKEKHPAVVIVSNDEVRKDLFGTEVCNPSQNSIVYDEVYRRVEKALTEKHDVIVDGTHVHPVEWTNLRYACLIHNAIMIAKLIDVEVDAALENLKHRSYKIPKDVIEEKYNALQKSKTLLPLFFNWVDEFDL